jgi:phosphoribosylformimino-5-aminoimidazole carboxamide ribotide isomerase
VLVVPAIDLRNGKCVRMKQGDPTTATEYDGDPVERATAFVAQGARRLHVIDLDGAFGSGENMAAVERICKAVEVPVQTGGGLRTVMHAENSRYANR